MRNTLLSLCALVFAIVIVVIAHYQGSIEIRATTAHALVHIPAPVIDGSASTIETPEASAQQAALSQSIPVPEPKQVVPQGAAGLPVRVIIPSIGLDSPIQNVGVNKKGEMDVPSGETRNVGWYKDGTVPGKRGSAVLAAHVFAAFEDLDQLVPGAEIFIETKNGTRLRFLVEDTKTYALKDLSANFLFNRRDDQRLNLITCAGAFVPSIDTYDHRHVVYATLA